MKVGIVCFWDRLATPYLAKYEAILQEQGITYTCLLWDRSRTEKEPVQKDTHDKYICILEKTGIIGKILSFLQWRKQIYKLLKAEKYDYLIILTTHPAILIYPMLIQKYKGRFIFDIRDYTQEKYSLYRKAVMRIIDTSAFTTISSKGFLRWLDYNKKIVPNHNITIKNEVLDKVFDFNKQIVEFTFVGNVRLDRQTEALLITLAKSKRYHLRFVGRVLSSCNIKEIIQQHDIKNASIEGAFDISEKLRIYAETDIINAVYANAVEHLALGDATPIPNRLYDAIIFKVPLIASKGTYLAELIDIYHLGLAINGFDKDVETQIDQYLENFEKKPFIDGCRKLLDEVIQEENIFQKKLISVLSSWSDNK